MEPLSNTRRRVAVVAAVAAGAVLALFLILRLAERGKIPPGLVVRSQIQLPPGAPSALVTANKVPITIEVLGTIQSRTPVEAASRVAARVAEVRVRAGDAVKPGEVLVMLDAADLAAHRAEAEAGLGAARAELARATADHDRYRDLVKRGSVTVKEFETVEASFKVAQAKLREAEAELAAAKAALNYARVISPVKGVVAERMVEPGDLALPGKPLVRLYDAAALRVELQVPEQAARLVRIGTGLEVHVDATGEDLATTVDEIVPMADPRSRTFLVRAALPAGRGLRPGMFARAGFTAGSETVLTVPRDAVETLGQLQTTRVLSDGVEEIRQVATGRVLGERVEVLAGLRKGERVLLRRRDAASHE